MTVVVNSQQAAVGTTAATTQAITPTGIVAGRSLVLLVGNAGGGATGTVTAVSDTGGNTWTLASPPNGGVAGVSNTKMAVAYCHNVVAPGTITATMGSIAQRKLLLLEITGLQNTPHDIAGQDITAAASTGNVAPSVAMTAPDFCIALVCRGGTVDPTGVTAGWTQNTTGLPDNTAPILRAAWQEFSASGASGTCTFTFAASAQAGLGMIAFKVAAADAWAPQAVTDSSMSVERPARYPGVRSQVTSVLDSPDLAPSVLPSIPPSRIPFYSGGRSQVSGVFANPAAAPDAAILTPASARSSFYAAPRSQVVGAFDNPIRDALLSPVSDRITYYAGPRSQVIGAFDNPAVASTDPVAMVALSARLPIYSSVRSLIVGAFDNPTVQGTTNVPPPALSPRTPYYRGSYSAVSHAADEAIPSDNSDWAAVVQSRIVPFYRPLPERVIASFTPTVSSYAPLVISRLVARYGPPPSLVSPVYDQPPTVFGTDFVPPVLSRAVPFYRPPASFAVLQAAGVVIVPDTWASVVQTRVPPGAPQRLSQAIPLWLPTITPDALVPVAQAPVRPVSRTLGSSVTTDFAAAAPAQGYVAVATSAPTMRALVRQSLTTLPLAGLAVVTLPPSGGGGDWVIWVKPDFPGNRAGAWPKFKKPPFTSPSRREQRGY